MDISGCVQRTGHRYRRTGVYLLRTRPVPQLRRHQEYPIVLQQLLRRHQRKAPLRHQEAERALVHRAIAVRVIKQRTRQMARERGRGAGMPRLNFHERTRFYCQTSREQQKHQRSLCEIISKRTTNTCAHIPNHLLSRLVVGNKNLASDKTWKQF